MNKYKLARIYTKLLKDHPLMVQSTQTGVIMSMGDLMAQTAVEKKTRSQIELIRTAHFFTLGTILVGPASAMWYKVLSKTMGEGGTSVALKKVAADQLLFAPTFMVIFITALNILQGNNLEHIQKELQAKYTQLLIANYKVWPAVQLLNFYMVPLNYQVLFVQVVALFWNAFVSWHLKQERKH